MELRVCSELSALDIVVEVMAHEDEVEVDDCGGVETKGRERKSELRGSSRHGGANQTQPLAHRPGHGTCPKLLE